MALERLPMSQQQIEQARLVLQSFQHHREADRLHRALLEAAALVCSITALIAVASGAAVQEVTLLFLLLACLWIWGLILQAKMRAGAWINCDTTLHQLSEVGAPETFCEVRALRSVEPVASFLERFEATGRTQLLRGELNAIRKSIVFGKGDFL